MKISEVLIGKHIIRYRMARRKEMMYLESPIKVHSIQNGEIWIQDSFVPKEKIILPDIFHDRFWMEVEEMFSSPSERLAKYIGKEIKYMEFSYTWPEPVTLLNAGPYHLEVQVTPTRQAYISTLLYPEEKWEPITK